MAQDNRFCFENKRKWEFYLRPFTKVHSKCMKDLTVKAKPQKTMKDNIFTVLSKGFSFYFLLNLGHINLKSKCKGINNFTKFTNDTIKNWKWRAINITKKASIFRTRIPLENKKNRSNHREKLGKDMNKQLSKEEIWGVEDIKRCTPSV